MTHYITTVRGRRHEWLVTVDEASVADMRADGVDVQEVFNTIPLLVVDAGMTRAWVFVQDLWNMPSRVWRKIRGKP